jgi:uncharacterized protein YdeI (BOF family)
MKSLTTKFALSALAVAMLATPALAQKPRRQTSQQQTQQFQGPNNDIVQPGQAYVYPNGATRSGSAASVESGAEFNLQQE